VRVSPTGYVMLALTPVVYACLAFGRVQIPAPSLATDSRPLAQVRATGAKGVT
jgi:hypothetical protein